MKKCHHCGKEIHFAEAVLLVSFVFCKETDCEKEFRQKSQRRQKKTKP